MDEEWRVTTNGYKISFWAEENVLELDRSGGCTTLQMSSCCGIAHFTMINLKSCAFCLKLKKERMKPDITGERGQ